MEFPNVGCSCSVKDCNKLIFLPFECEACKSVFCDIHFTEHLTICEQRIKSLSNVLTNENFPRYQCSEPGCSDKSIVPLICEKCKKHFCITHRHTSGNGCEKIDSKELQEATEKINAPKVKYLQAKTIVDQQIDNKLLNAKRKNTANKVQLLRLKSKATGLKSIPVDDRIYFLVYNDKFCPNGHAVFVSRTWTIGRIIDAIATECKIPNNNNKALSPKLHLFNKINNEIVSEDMSVKINELLNTSTTNVENGNSLILDYYAEHLR